MHRSLQRSPGDLRFPGDHPVDEQPHVYGRVVGEYVNISTYRADEVVYVQGENQWTENCPLEYSSSREETLDMLQPTAVRWRRPQVFKFSKQ